MRSGELLRLSTLGSPKAKALPVPLPLGHQHDTGRKEARQGCLSCATSGRCPACAPDGLSLQFTRSAPRSQAPCRTCGTSPGASDAPLPRQALSCALPGSPRYGKRRSNSVAASRLASPQTRRSRTCARRSLGEKVQLPVILHRRRMPRLEPGSGTHAVRSLDPIPARQERSRSRSIRVLNFTSGMMITPADIIVRPGPLSSSQISMTLSRRSCAA